MKAFDLHIHSVFSEGTSSLEDLATTAKSLGYSGICFSTYFQNFDKIKKIYEEIEKVKEKVKIEIFLGIEARNVKELSFLADKRKKFDILLVSGGDLKLNRLACETPEVDILTHPELNRNDSGLNHILVKMAAKNNVAIEINFREVLITSKKTRAKIISNMVQNVKLAKKYNAPLIICSGSISHWELRDPITLSSFGTLLGLDFNEARKCIGEIPKNIVEEIKKRRSERWIMPGVGIIKKVE
ncbi:MAG: RNase P subunit p30 family protein [Candidatus Aenigmatarchaeota archaeon]